MARPKRPPHPLLRVAHDYIVQHEPDLQDAKLHLRILDGPHDGPRFAVSAVECMRESPECPHHVTVEPDDCPIYGCDLRAAIRLLFSREGKLLKVSRSTIRWTATAPHTEPE